MISLRNCCAAAIRYEIMKVVPLILGSRASGLLTGKVQLHPANPGATNEKQFRDYGPFWPPNLGFFLIFRTEFSAK